MSYWSPLTKKESGYSAGREQWESFLTEWKHKRISGEDLPFADFLNFSKTPSGDMEASCYPHPTYSRLPQSLLDFHTVYRSMGGNYRQETKNDGIGVLKPDEITPLSLYYPQFYEIRIEHSVNATDADYAKYGVEQDFGEYRTDYSKNALVIAQYSFDDSELMLLYPDNVTNDGEMEVALLVKAGEFRATSFAEMMRQLSMYCLTDPDTLPPYEQSRLRNSIADCINLADVWWK